MRKLIRHKTYIKEYNFYEKILESDIIQLSISITYKLLEILLN